MPGEMLETIRQLLRRKPFSPIRVIMRSGKRFEINNPERVAVSPTRVFLAPDAGRRMEWLKGDEIELVFVPRRASQLAGGGRFEK